MMTTMDEGVDDSLYDHGEDKGHKAPPKSVDEQEEENPTALIPKSLLAGKKFEPGDEIVLEIVAIHGEEAEVKYAKEKSEEEHDPEMHESGEDEDMKQLNERY